MSAKYELGPDIDLDEDVVLDKRGRRIDEARAQEIAEQTLQEVRRGRPSLSGEAAHSPRVSFRVAPSLQERAARRAEEEGRAVSVIARDALEHYLEAEPAEPVPGGAPNLGLSGLTPELKAHLDTLKLFSKYAHTVTELQLPVLLAASRAAGAIEALIPHWADAEEREALVGVVESWRAFHSERLTVRIRIVDEDRPHEPEE